MPHLTLEYTANLPAFGAATVLLALNRALVASGEFDEADIKSRAVRLDTFVVGTVPPARGFAHAKLAILTGRSEETKRALGEALLQVLEQSWEPPAGVRGQLCVEIQEIERASYTKVTLGP